MRIKINPNLHNYMRKTPLVILILILLIVFIVFPIGILPFYKDNMFNINDETIQTYGLMGDSFGIINALFSLCAFIGILLTLYYQNQDNKRRTIAELFYQMLDVQQKVIEEINVSPVRKVKEGETINIVKGRKAFIEFKIQMKYLIKAVNEVVEKDGFNLSDVDIADISYAVFFYGSDSSWKPFMIEYLKDYDETERLVDAIIKKLDKNKMYILTRPNQNYLSVYFRNMYNAIKHIDNSKLLSSKEKNDYVKILRSQLSNAELYILFFNVISRFGKKWIDNDYITKYQLIQNLPSKYCDGYDPKEYFPDVRFEEEEKCLSPFKKQIVQRKSPI